MAAGSFMKWFPSDWRADPRVQACAPLTRYVWFEMLQIMHDAKPKGHLTLDGEPMQPEMLSGLIRVPLEDVQTALVELEANRVFDRSKHKGIIFNRRMVQEHKRWSDFQVWGRLGGNPNLHKQKGNGRGVNPRDNQLNQNPETLEDSQDCFNFPEESESSVVTGHRNGSAKQTLKPKKNGTRLDENWEPSTDTIKWALGRGHSKQVINDQFNRFRDYWLAKAGKDAVKMDWERTFSNWIRNYEDKYAK